MHEFEAEDGVAATYWGGEPSRCLRSDILTSEETLEGAKAFATAESDEQWR